MLYETSHSGVGGLAAPAVHRPTGKPTVCAYISFCQIVCH